MSLATKRARLQYLGEAAQEIHKEAPAVASALGAEHYKLISRDKREQKLVHVRRNHVCFACGAIFERPHKQADDGGAAVREQVVPSNKSKAAKRRARSRAALQKSASSQHGQASTASSAEPVGRGVNLECTRCHRITHLKPVSSQSGRQSRKRAEPSPTQQNSNHSLVEAKAAAHSSGKKRAKARKQASLQAILARTKATSSVNNSLDLMDFMSND